MDIWKIVNDIYYDKKNVIHNAENETDKKEAIKCYNAFVINRALSQGIDTIFYANEMNKCHELDPIMQNDFLVSSVRRKKRYNKWAKSAKDIDVEMIQAYYDYNPQRAREVLKLLTKKDLENIRNSLFEGGIKSK